MKAPSFVVLVVVLGLCLGAEGRSQQWLSAYDAATVVLGPFDAPIRALLDVDADGSMDAVGLRVQAGASVVTLYRNTGAGALAPIWTGVAPAGIGGVGVLGGGVVTGDFDGDTRPDFAVWTNSYLQVYRTNGVLAPTVGTGMPLTNGAVTVLSRDLNGDSLDDVVVFDGTWLRVGLLSVGGTSLGISSFFHGLSVSAGAVVRHANGSHSALLHDAGGQMLTIGIASSGASFTVGPILSTGLSAPLIAAGDVDGDGDEDLALFGSNGSFRILRQDAAGSLSLGPVGLGGPATHLVDIDADGDLDGLSCLATGSFLSPGANLATSQFGISYNDGTGSFAPTFYFPAIGAAALAGVADMDGNGLLDLVAGRSIYYSSQLLDTNPFLGYAGLPGTSSIFWTHRDGDGDGDIDIGFSPSGVFANDGAGRMTQQSFSLIGPAPSSAIAHAAIDLDSDGDMDFLVQSGLPGNPNNQGIYTLFQDAPQQFRYAPTFVPVVAGHLPISNAFRSRDVDLDGDGLLDLIMTTELAPGTSTSGDQMSVYRNLGGGTFSTPATLPFTLKGVGDFDGDGRPDLVVNQGIQGLMWIRNLGGMQAGAAVSLGVWGTNSYADRISLIDVDGDGDLDILAPEVVTGAASKTVVTLLNNGFGIFTAVRGGFLAFHSSGSAIIRCADLDRDGNVDVLQAPVINAPNATAIHLGTGSQNFAAPVLQVMRMELLNDYDGDGAPDAYETFPRAFHRCLLPHTTLHGTYRQRGVSGVGSGGARLLLGATGPFRGGEVLRVRLRGGLGGAAGVLAISRIPLVNPVPVGVGQWLYLDVVAPTTFFVPVVLGGSTGVVGAGTLGVGLGIPLGLSGLDFVLQAAVADISAPFGIVLSNAIDMVVGG